jgi:deoxyribodipyrimidine photo-lyase
MTAQNKKSEAISILWFRRDLRVSDHAPLSAALKKHKEKGTVIVPLYVLDNHSPNIANYGSASLWWLHHSLNCLSKSLEQRGNKLLLRSGPIVDVIRGLFSELNVESIYFHHSVLPGEAEIETELAELCNEKKIECKRFKGELLFEPKNIATGSGTPYKVFTPFWRACLNQPKPTKSSPVPKTIPGPKQFPNSDTLENWKLLPKNPDWAAEFNKLWHPGEEHVSDVLDVFIKGPIGSYKKMRDYPAIQGTSKISPYLAFGNISIRELWHKADGHEGADFYQRELGWREFCYYLLAHWPQIIEEPFQEKFKNFTWEENNDYLKAWQQGKTGYPIIDAAMRQLWQTGWMHNRLRMVVGSFLVKNLRLHWHHGANWFWDTLLDADLANNTGGWQWVAGTGADAAPYFRIFNPVTQSEKFDKDGDFIREFVPELSNMPKKYIHNPSSAPKEVLKDAGVTLGKTYPKAIVDLKTSRQIALDAYTNLQNKE